jgi:hypothetical protein
VIREIPVRREPREIRVCRVRLVLLDRVDFRDRLDPMVSMDNKDLLDRQERLEHILERSLFLILVVPTMHRAHISQRGWVSMMSSSTQM